MQTEVDKLRHECDQAEFKNSELNEELVHARRDLYEAQKDTRKVTDDNQKLQSRIRDSLS